MPVSTVAAPDAGMSTFYMFLLQRGGSLYNDALNATRLDGEESIAAFKQWTSFYVDYTLPQTYDAANRFRLRNPVAARRLFPVQHAAGICSRNCLAVGD